MNIIMMGAQGTGKGTVAGLIKGELNIPHISTGEMFRKNIKEGTELGKQAEALINNGELVPDDITNKMVDSRLQEENCKNGFILDGYPRNLEQAEELDKILNRLGKKVELVVNLCTPTEEIIERVMARRKCPICKREYNMVLNKPKNGEFCDDCNVELSKRADDTEEGLKKRLDIFFTQTQPVIDHYDRLGVVLREDLSIKINRLGPDVAKDIIEYIKNK